MQVTHLKTNSKNESEFGSIEISLDRQGVEQFANLRAPHGMIFNETDAGHEYPWHNAPQRQWVVTLQGEIEVKLRNGNLRGLALEVYCSLTTSKVQATRHCSWTRYSAIQHFPIFKTLSSTVSRVLPRCMESGASSLHQMA
jgi:hypothetical protein